MNITSSMRRWSEIQGLAVVSLADGKKLGTVDDFYFEPLTNAVHGLRVKVGIFGYKALTTNVISAIGQDAITTANEEMLIEEKNDAQLPQLPLGSSLISYKVMNEGGTVVGKVGSILLNTSPPTALHVAGFELAGGPRESMSRHHRSFSSNEVVRYDQDVIVILDQVAKSLG